MSPPKDPTLFAIILAGGKSSRLHKTSPGSIQDKPLLMLDGKRVITRVIDDVTHFVPAEQTVVVGPDTLPTGIVPTVYEDPPQSGPYMAVRAGLRHFTQRFGPALPNEGVFLFGADMPFIGESIEQLVRHHRDVLQQTKVAIAQATDKLQPLFSYWPRGVAEQIFANQILNAGVMQALNQIDYRVVKIEATAVTDLDTYQDVVNAGIDLPVKVVGPATNAAGPKRKSSQNRC